MKGGYGGNLAYIDRSLENLILDNFGNFTNFKNEFSEKSDEIEGSGWAWLAYN